METQWPLPTQSELAEYYGQSFESGMYSEFTAADEMKKMTASQRVKEISKHVPVAGIWLDVGCANGVFVQELLSREVNAEGIDLADSAVAQGREKGLTLHCGTVDDLPDNFVYDGITAFDVIEHVLDPRGFLKSLTKRVAPGGHIVLTLPNTGAAIRKLMGRRWFFYIPEEHLFYFNKKNLGELIGSLGLEVINIGATYKPMTVDYALTQFAEYNPLIHKLLKVPAFFCPNKMRRRPVPFPVGELRAIARVPLLA